MNVKNGLLLMLIGLMICGCQQVMIVPTTIVNEEEKCTATLEPTIKPTESQTQEESDDGAMFAIYLVFDPQMTGADLIDYELEALPLAEKPLISTDDLLRYDWDTHEFNVTEESFQRLVDEIFGNVPVSGQPFVVLANDERIYAGAFWTLISSLSFDGVVILEPFDTTSTKLSLALGYPTEEFFNGHDPRGDPRIREVLEETGILGK